MFTELVLGYVVDIIRKWRGWHRDIDRRKRNFVIHTDFVARQVYSSNWVMEGSLFSPEVIVKIDKRALPRLRDNKSDELVGSTEPRESRRTPAFQVNRAPRPALPQPPSTCFSSNLQPHKNYHHLSISQAFSPHSLFLSIFASYFSLPRSLTTTYTRSLLFPSIHRYPCQNSNPSQWRLLLRPCHWARD